MFTEGDAFSVLVWPMEPGRLCIDEMGGGEGAKFELTAGLCPTKMLASRASPTNMSVAT